MQNYFIIRVNYDKSTYYLNILYIITQALPITRINWKIINPSTSSKKRKSKHQHKLFYSNDSIIPLSNDFLFTNPLSSLPLFHSLIFALVGISMDGILKNVMVLFISIQSLNQYVYAYKKLETAIF